MRNFYFIIFLFFCFLTNAQSVNLYHPTTNAIYPSQQYFCMGESFNLKVDAVATSTGDYLIDQLTAFNVPAANIDIPFSNKIGNDHFSQPITIPFAFDFYGKQYSKLVVGSNGRLLFGSDAEFNDLHTNRYVDKTHSENNASSINIKIPSTAYNQIDSNDYSRTLNYAQIFFGYTDLGYYNTTHYDKLTYGIVTYNGQQGLLINFDRVLETTVGSGFSSTITSQVLILANNQVLIKVVKTNGTRNAIIGLQNETGNAARWPVNSEATSVYNNGKWISNGSTAWAFKPSLNLTPQFKWFRNGVALTETSDVLSNFTPNDGDVLKVEVTYHDPLGAQVGAPVSDDITFKKIQVPVIASSSSGGCVSGVTLTIPANPDLNFEWFRVGNPTVLGTGDSYYANQTGSYFVRSSRKTLPICSVDSSPVNVNLSSTIPAFNVSNHPLNFCENTGATTKSINLYDYYPQNSSYSVNFTENGIAVPNPASFVISGNTLRTLNIKVNDPASGCNIDLNFTLRYDSLPAAINNLPQKYCFGGTSQDISQFLQNLAGTNFAIFDYQYSIDGINYTTNSIINPKINPKVWIKISPKNPTSGSCTTVSTILFTEDSKVVANTPTTQLSPQCASATQTFNLASLIPEINPDPNVTVTFHQSLIEAQSGVNAVPYNFRSGLNTTTLYIRVVNNTTNCVSPDHPTITLLVYLKPTLLVNSISKSNCQGNTIFNLTQNASALTNATAPVTVNLEYYSTIGTLLTAAQILNYDESILGSTPYLKLVYNTTCSDTIPFNLTYLPKPVAIINQILICAEVNYSLQDFKNKTIANPASYIFTDLSGNPLPANFNVSTLPLTVNFLIKDIANNCISNPQTVTFKKGSNSAILVNQTDFTLCDTDFDGKTEFNLDSKKSVFTNDSSATLEYFKDSNYTQLIAPTYTNETAFAQTVYVRISIPGFCPSTAQIHLKVNTPTKSSTLVDKYLVCFDETITIDAGSENVSWKWSTEETTQTINLKVPGSYSVELTNANGCSYTHHFIISDENQPKIDVINQTNTSIEVIASGGTKPYRYYFNGIPQTSNILQNPGQSSYEIQVESATGCFGPPKTIYFIKINNAFTPNGDGINDKWKIENLDKMESVSLIIINRNGTKVFESTNPTQTEWDGRQSGRELPTSSYWYIVSWYDAVTQKNEQRQGWILLKNRN